MERSRLVDRDPETGRYRLGLRFLTFGDAVRARIDVVSIADPVLRQLRDEVRLTVYLAIRNEWGAVCLKRLAGPDFDVLAWKPGQRLPFHRGAGPRALLAALPDGELEAYLAEPMDRPTRSGPLTVDQVRQMVAITRERGWSLNAEDLTAGVSSVGVALRDVSGSAQYAISVAGLAARFQGSSLGTQRMRWWQRSLGWLRRSTAASDADTSRRGLPSIDSPSEERDRIWLTSVTRFSRLACRTGQPPCSA